MILQPRILLPLLCFATAPIVACSEAPESESGSLRMGVAGQDADGNFYRLRSASFDAYGPIYTSFYSDAEPYTTQYLAMDVPTGDYTIQLQPGWYVEQWDPFTDNTYPLEARLISANPATATVAELSTAIVTFSFYVEGVGAISLGDGSLAVDVDFDTEPPICDPNTQDCADGLACALTDLWTGRFECGPLGYYGAYQPCYGAFDCEMDYACVPSTENIYCVGADCCVPTCDVAAPSCPNGEACLPLDGTTGLCSTN